MRMGMGGIEVFHPKHDPGDERKLGRFCQDHNLMITGGSDFHGHEKREFDNLGLKYVNLDYLKLRLLNEKS